MPPRGPACRWAGDDVTQTLDTSGKGGPEQGRTGGRRPWGRKHVAGTAGAEAQAAAGASMAGEQRAGARAQRGPSAGPRGTVGAWCAFATSDARGTCRGAAGGVTGARRVWQGSRTLGGTDEGAGEGPGASGGGGALGRGPEPRAELQKGGAAARRLLSTRARVHPCAARASTCACVPCAVLVSPGVCARGRVCVRVGATGPGAAGAAPGVRV